MNKYLVVNGVTLLSLLVGVFAVKYSFLGPLYFSFGLALLAFVFDMLDGYLARKLKAESFFGALFDSISDVVVYLVYPASVLYNLLGFDTVIGIVAIILFFLTGIFRLIRFTSQGFGVEGDKKYYKGIPVFFSHFMILVLLVISIIDKRLVLIFGPLLLVLLSFFMVSNVRIRKPLKEYLFLYMSLVLILSSTMFFYE